MFVSKQNIRIQTYWVEEYEKYESRVIKHLDYCYTKFQIFLSAAQKLPKSMKLSLKFCWKFWTLDSTSHCKMQHRLHPGIAIIVSDIVCFLVEPEIGGEQAFGFQESLPRGLSVQAWFWLVFMRELRSAALARQGLLSQASLVPNQAALIWVCIPKLWKGNNVKTMLIVWWRVTCIPLAGKCMSWEHRLHQQKGLPELHMPSPLSWRPIATCSSSWCYWKYLTLAVQQSSAGGEKTLLFLVA